MPKVKRMSKINKEVQDKIDNMKIAATKYKKADKNAEIECELKNQNVIDTTMHYYRKIKDNEIIHNLPQEEPIFDNYAEESGYYLNMLLSYHKDLVFNHKLNSIYVRQQYIGILNSY